MYPNVYLEDSFTIEFDHYAESLPAANVYSSKDLRRKNESLRRIHDLLMSSNVYSDFSKEDVENCWTSTDGIAPRLKDQIIRSILKSAVYTESGRSLFLKKRNCETAFTPDILYFTGDSFEDSVEKSEQTGQIIIGKSFLDRPFFLNHTFPSVDTDSTLFQISKLVHPCSSMVVIDKHVFKDTEKLDAKIPNLIRVIEWIMPKQLSRKFEVCIISENSKSNMTHLISNRVKKILTHFGDKISLHVFTPSLLEEIETSDRFILTNYALISIPHPFDRPTTISCNFFPSQPEKHSVEQNDSIPENPNIEAYKTWKSKLVMAKKIINRTSNKKYPSIQYVWTSEEFENPDTTQVNQNFRHRIFNIG